MFYLHYMHLCHNPKDGSRYLKIYYSDCWEYIEAGYNKIDPRKRLAYSLPGFKQSYL